MSESVYIVDGTLSQRRALSGMGANVLTSKADVADAIKRRPPANSLWIALHELSAHWLAHALANSSVPVRGGFLAMEEVSPELITLFADRFGKIAVKPQSRLPITDIYTIFLRKDRDEFCIGATIDQAAEALICVRGDLTVISVPLSFFQSSSDIIPDFNDFKVIDHGRTLRFGKYEAAFSALLYERDREYRRRLNRMRAQKERSLGASMRRLRKQRGLRLSDFGELEKTIARIERGEVKHPRKQTLAQIAGVLGVSSDQIAEY